MEARSLGALTRAMTLAMGVLAFLGAKPASAQQMTLEGTQITNTATVSFTDTNGNSYTPAQASVTVTVGFKSGISVADQGPYTVSTGQSTAVGFKITNTGNGDDTPNPSAPTLTGGFFTVTQYCFKQYTAADVLVGSEVCNATFASLVWPTLQTGQYVIFEVKYTVATGFGGVTGNAALTAASTRTPATTASDNTNVTVSVSGSVAVTPDAGTVSRLPSNPDNVSGNTVITYTAQYTVTNNYNGTVTFALAVASSGTGVSFTSSPYLCSDVGKTAITQVTINTGGGASALVCVDYRAGNQPAGTTGSITLTATYNSASDAGDYTITIVRPVIAVVKTAWLDNGSGTAASGTQIDGSLPAAQRPKPGDVIWYKITVTNTGTAPTAISISDPLPTQVSATGTYYTADIASPTLPQVAWSFTGSSATNLVAQLSTMAASESRYVWVKVTIN